MVVSVAAVDGFSRIKVVGVDDEVIVDGIRLAPGQSKTFRLDPEVWLQVGNARAAHVTVDGVEYGAMGKKPEAMSWLIRQGERPRPIS